PVKRGLRAGVALQAYLPDSWSAQRELTAWARNRVNRRGAPVRIRLVAHPQRVVEGRVERLGPVVGPGSRSLPAWVDFDRPWPVRLQHNLLARVTVSTGRPAAVLAVPLPAVVRDGARSFVFLQKPDGPFERRRVQTGRADDRFVEVLAGVAAGDQLAVGGVAQLQTAYAAIR
ncbi:MAG: hypothetical protein ACK5EA_29680, partial [Planctomycetaceae bacterium]